MDVATVLALFEMYIRKASFSDSINNLYSDKLKLCSLSSLSTNRYASIMANHIRIGSFNTNSLDIP